MYHFGAVEVGTRDRRSCSARGRGEIRDVAEIDLWLAAESRLAERGDQVHRRSSPVRDALARTNRAEDATGWTSKKRSGSAAGN